MTKQTYCFSGSHCTGKTTLINTLIEKESTILLSPSNSTDLKKLEGTSTDLIQMLILNREQQTILDLQKLDDNQLVLKDRCIIDTLVYTRFFFKQGKVLKVTLDAVEESAKRLLVEYKHIFITPIAEIEYLDREKFSMSKDTREEIAEMFLEFYEENKDMSNITLLKSNTLQGRLEEVLLTIIERKYS